MHPVVLLLLLIVSGRGRSYKELIDQGITS